MAKISKSEIDEGKTKAAISYIWMVGLIMLFVEKKNKFVRFHAKQGATLSLLSLIPFVGLIMWIIMLFGFIMALTGKSTKIPLVYEIGDKIAEMLKKV